MVGEGERRDRESSETQPYTNERANDESNDGAKLWGLRTAKATTWSISEC